MIRNHENMGLQGEPPRLYVSREGDVREWRNAGFVLLLVWDLVVLPCE